MNAIEILLISLGVSVDAFAVSVGGALSCPGKMLRSGTSAALFFGGFQFLMPVAGFFAAGALTDALAAWDHWIAFAFLGLVGGKMVVEGIKSLRWREKNDAEPPAAGKNDFFSPANMIIPAVATSVDALAVGASLAFAGVTSVWLPAAAMGVVTGAVSFAGVVLGHKLKRFAGQSVMSIIGGSVILLIGIKILWEHCW